MNSFAWLRTFELRNIPLGFTLYPCQLEQYLYDDLSLEIGAQVPIVDGFYNWIRSEILELQDLYFEEEIHEVLRSSIQQAYDIACDIEGVLYSALLALGYKEGPLTSLSRSLSILYWFMWTVQDRWVPVMKYHKDWLFVHYASLVHPEYPEMPSFDIGKPGRLYFKDQDRFLKGRLRSGCLITLNTVLQGIKKGMLPVGDKTVLSAAQKHAKVLSQNALSSPELLEEVARTSLEVFGEISNRDLSYRSNHSISSHSCVESVRSEEGMNGYWKRTVCSDPDRLMGDMLNYGYNTMLVGFQTRSGLVSGELRAPCDLVFDDAILRLRSFVRNVDLCKIYPVRVKFILEPLKVRTISCGSFESYSCFGPLQKLLWRRLQRFSCFILTGEPIDSGLVQKVVCGRWAPDDLLVSGDYSAATDNLHLDLTTKVFDTISLTSAVYNSLSAGLGPQIIDYQGNDWCCYRFKEPAYSQLLPDQFLQTNGQLMGSPLSFPILCLINAACFRLAYESFYGRLISIRDLPTLINGDDIGFRGSWEFYQHWRNIVESAGFLPSVGKNFTSREFININSQYFAVSTVSGITYVREQIPYVNMGLITGRKKGDTLDEDGFSSPEMSYLRLRSSARAVVRELTKDLPLEIAQCAYQEWKKRVVAEQPTETCFTWAGYGTESGPPTRRARVQEHYLGQLKFGKIPNPKFCGSSDDTVMGSYWKPWVQFYDEKSVKHDFERQIWKARNKIPRRWREQNDPILYERSEILLWGASWTELQSGGVDTAVFERCDYGELTSQKVTDDPLKEITNIINDVRNKPVEPISFCHNPISSNHDPLCCLL